MQTSHSAHGLRLQSNFPLPGMTPARAANLPSLSLQLEAPATLARLWSGCSDPPTWRGRLGDGLDLSIEQGVSGDTLFSYGERAHFHLDASGQTLVCLPREPGLDWQRVLLSKVIAIVSLMRGYEALHASAVDSPWGTAAILAPSGTGKTTLAIELLRREWSLFADDILTLQRTVEGVRAHPGTPHMNLAVNQPDGNDPQALGETLGFLAGERWLAARRTVAQTRSVSLLCVLERGPGRELECQTVPTNPLLLAPYMLGLSSDVEQRRDRFLLYADLMESAKVVRLTAGPEHRTCELADLLEQALAYTPEPIAEAIA